MSQILQQNNKNIPLKVIKRKEYLLLPLLFSAGLDILANKISQEKMKNIEIWKYEEKVIFVDYSIAYLNTQENQQKTVNKKKFN